MMHHFIACTMFNVTTRYIAENISCAKIFSAIIILRRTMQEVDAMIIEIRTKNCFAFEEEISFFMKADMRNKKFASNVHRENNFNVLKTAGFYGPNNVGKD